MTLFATFDGPKAVGKSTLISVVQRNLFDRGFEPLLLVEKDLLPEQIKREVSILYGEYKINPCMQTDAAIADCLLQARLHISKNILQLVQCDVVLMDRWYPSDAVFRRYIDAEKIIDDNIASGVRVPDVIFSVICDSEISWQRAHQRSRSLDSKVVYDFASHRETSIRFESIAARSNWTLLRSDVLSPDELACKVIKKLFDFGLSKGIYSALNAAST